MAKGMWIAPSVPFELLDAYLPKIIAGRLPIELVIKHEVLDKLSFSDFKGLANRLKDSGIELTVHLPFMDLSLAAFDPWIRKVSLLRLFQGMEIASLFEPKICVFHSGYHQDYHREQKDKWRDIFVEESLSRILNLADELNLTLALENTFEPIPDFMKPIFEAYKNRLYWCFDPGHAKVFSEADELTWFDILSPFLIEMHCHDNLGKFDDHLPLGEGVINFQEIFKAIRKQNKEVFLTVEARSEEAFLKSLAFIRSYLDRDTVR
jgi:sugar phosphate isomerase/epimerase